uniref:Uncharacterized protein n=1 Tax=viral metagenome TaxID=1070528 RepID=A0A6C0BJY9_9ZZZZ
MKNRVIIEMKPILDITSDEWTEILAQHPQHNYQLARDGTLPLPIDALLRKIAKSSIRQIEHDNQSVWERCIKRDIPLEEHNFDPVWLGQNLAEMDELKTPGHVLLIAGDDGLSLMVRALTNSRFSHVGMVIPGETPILWQSYINTPTKANYPPHPDFVPGMVTNWGADVSDLARFIVMYLKISKNVKFVLRKLTQPLTETQFAHMSQYINLALTTPVKYPSATRLTLMYLRDKYPQIQPLCDHLLGPGPIEKGGEFCSMLTAHTYAEAGVLNPSTKGIEGYFPGDFSLDYSRINTQPMCGDVPLFEPNEIELRFVHPVNYNYNYWSWCNLF